MKKLKEYKEKNFDSWLEFILTLGTIRFNDGGFLITLYFWGGSILMFCMYLMLKFGL